MWSHASHYKREVWKSSSHCFSLYLTLAFISYTPQPRQLPKFGFHAKNAHNERLLLCVTLCDLLLSQQTHLFMQPFSVSAELPCFQMLSFSAAVTHSQKRLSFIATANIPLALLPEIILHQIKHRMLNYSWQFNLLLLLKMCETFPVHFSQLPCWLFFPGKLKTGTLKSENGDGLEEEKETGDWSGEVMPYS